MAQGQESKKCSRIIEAESNTACTNQAAPTHPWCKPCQNAHRKTWQHDKATREQRAWFIRGIEAMREALMEEMVRVHNASRIPDKTRLSLFEVAGIIRQAPRPAYPEGRSVDPNETRILS